MIHKYIFHNPEGLYVVSLAILWLLDDVVAFWFIEQKPNPGLYKIEKNYDDGATKQTIVVKENNE